MATPLPLLDLVNSLRLEGIPTRAAPGDLISPRVIPDLSPRAGGLPNAVLEALTRGETLAEIVADLAPILSYIAQTLGIDTASVLKAVEFNRPVEARADLVDVSSSSVRDLPHLIPVGAANVLQISQLVEGLIAHAKGRLDFESGEFLSQVTALIRKPAVLAGLPNAPSGSESLTRQGIHSSTGLTSLRQRRHSLPTSCCYPSSSSLLEIHRCRSAGTFSAMSRWTIRRSAEHLRGSSGRSDRSHSTWRRRRCR